MTSDQRGVEGLIYAGYSPHNQYMSFSFEVRLKGRVSVTAGESAYGKPKAERSIELDSKQVDSRETKRAGESPELGDRSGTRGLRPRRVGVLHFVL